MMSRVPLIGRLFWFEYLALFCSFIFIVVEQVVQVVTSCLPEQVIRLLYNQSKSLYDLLFPIKRDKYSRFAASIAEASDFTDICNLFGYLTEEHIVQTGDGYLLGLHRLPCRKGEEHLRVNQGAGSVQKKVVYLHHGLLMSSEVWVCLTEETRSLAFQLVEQGYDVWLGNNRGNKYSKKSVKHSPISNEFWSFSIDEFALYDVPDSIGYILEVTGQPSLSYIGFSQGSAQAFAALSIHPYLNQKIDVFVALAPAMAPARLSNPTVDSLMKASPDFLYLLFGRRSILSSTTMWQTILYPPLYTRIIDMSLSSLFNWKCKNISRYQKLAAYTHLFSFTSTKSIVHWFQIIRNKTFQFFDDEIRVPFSVGASHRFYKPAKYPTRNIRTPIVLLYGGSDSLVDIDVMLQRLPRGTVAKSFPKYEHLDFLWAADVDQLVFSHVFDALEHHGRTVFGKDHGQASFVSNCAVWHREPGSELKVQK